MLSKRLQDFLLNWSNPDVKLEDAGEFLRSPDGAPFLQWLPDELLAARRDGELTADAAIDLTGLHFDDQADVDDWLGDIWRIWFGKAYPDASSGGE